MPTVTATARAVRIVYRSLKGAAPPAGPDQEGGASPSPGADRRPGGGQKTASLRRPSHAAACPGVSAGGRPLRAQGRTAAALLPARWTPPRDADERYTWRWTSAAIMPTSSVSVSRNLPSAGSCLGWTLRACSLPRRIRSGRRGRRVGWGLDSAGGTTGRDGAGRPGASRGLPPPSPERDQPNRSFAPYVRLAARLGR